MIFNGFRKILVTQEGIKVLYPFNIFKQLIEPQTIQRVKVGKGVSGSHPFSYKIYYTKGIKNKTLGFSTEQYSTMVPVLTQFLLWNIKIEPDYNNFVKAYFEEAKSNVENSKPQS